MICDAHVHLKHGDAAGTEYSPEAIVRAMDGTGIEVSVVFAMSTTTRRSIEMAEAARDKYPDRLVPYAYALPHYEHAVARELGEALSEKGFRGIKLHAGECTLAGYVTDPVFELAGSHGVPCLVDFAGDYGACERIVRCFPGTTLIAAHLGKYHCTQPELIDRFIALAERHENLYLDASGVLLSWKIEEAVARAGADRIIFGTDGPQQAPDIVSFARSEVNRIRNLNLNDSAKEQILWGNIARILGLGAA